ncbi:hypothetical protein [Microvirga lotononidis]|uniref:Uncharacterized protein n=1 Tax=Microvirga lotononidis TaxID=864069 RepID=I4Z2H0_9HYPH|nr:hypothetical protein [Microvirga lotononidis]EIM30412.1 hypothetical protein MicloDRAFT_00009630 [Microvirga lotononidis]WQO30554.1 hypothetical protein U0023_24210 [Microvirga lotononidis]WQO30913.1 hypothetical protein U0023_26250 [Microvirga lotononidis]
MTPERFALMRHLLHNAQFDWTYGDTEYLREPVDFIPRYPNAVVDLPRIRKIAFTLHKDRVAMFDGSGAALTPSFIIAWVEAEGYVIHASAFDDGGDDVARGMIGRPCPKCRNR